MSGPNARPNNTYLATTSLIYWQVRGSKLMTLTRNTVAQVHKSGGKITKLLNPMKFKHSQCMERPTTAKIGYVPSELVP
jgi:hypothetical protein